MAMVKEWLARRAGAATRSGLAELLQLGDAQSPRAGGQPQGAPAVPEQYLVIIKCMDEAQQVKLLRMLQKQGYKAEAKTT